MNLKTKVGKYTISTVLLPISGIIPGGDYETMVFDDETGETDVRPEHFNRTNSCVAAEQWHARVVKELRDKNDYA